jgi:hypothetical protein
MDEKRYTGNHHRLSIVTDDDNDSFVLNSELDTGRTVASFDLLSFDGIGDAANIPDIPEMEKKKYG